ncbi:MAG: hypothetical protein ABI813_14525 [Bacteroidota bacterium]
MPESFGEGDNAFCYITDVRKPAYGAWWRHLAEGKNYIDEPISKGALKYELKMKPNDNEKGSFILKAKVNMAMTFGRSNPEIGTALKLVISTAFKLFIQIPTEKITGHTLQFMTKETMIELGKK